MLYTPNLYYYTLSAFLYTLYVVLVITIIIICVLGICVSWAHIAHRPMASPLGVVRLVLVRSAVKVIKC